MSIGLFVMALVGAVVGAVGWPLLTQPARVRRRMGWAATPQSTYILRIAGTILTVLGLVLIVFALSYDLFSR